MANREKVSLSESIAVDVSQGPRVIEVCGACRGDLGQQRYSAGRRLQLDRDGKPVIDDNGIPVVAEPGVVVCSIECARTIDPEA